MYSLEIVDIRCRSTAAIFHTFFQTYPAATEDLLRMSGGNSAIVGVRESDFLNSPYGRGFPEFFLFGFLAIASPSLANVYNLHESL